MRPLHWTGWNYVSSGNYLAYNLQNCSKKKKKLFLCSSTGDIAAGYHFVGYLSREEQMGD